VALLDTTVLVDLGRDRDRAPHRRASAAVRQILESGQSLFTSRVNEAEFRVGPELCRDRRKELEQVERVLAGIVILEFGAEAALRYAAIKAALIRRGQPAGDCDLLIASVALANGQRLLTRNPRHFMNIAGLDVDVY
jgi:predicted nucleic acid-binding protein